MGERTFLQTAQLRCVVALVVAGLALAASCGEISDATLDSSVAGTTISLDLPSSVAPPSSEPPEPSSATSSTSTTTATTVPARPTIVIGVAGDTSFTAGLDQRDPFGQVTDLLSAPDLMIVNLETAVADPDVGSVAVSKPFLFKSPPSALPLLVEAGIDVVGLANNHTLDYGPDALEQTLREVDAVGLHRVGAGIDETAAYQPLVIDVEGWRVGVVSLSRVPCDWSASGNNVRPQVAWACPPFLPLADAMVEATLADADVTIVMVHGGEEGVLCPSPFMTELTAHWAELGVDAIVNGHPHVVQGLTVVGETLVARSSGNFAFPSARGITANSAVFLFGVSETVDGKPHLDLSVEPVRVEAGVVRVPTEGEHAAILDQVAEYSTGVVIDADGAVTLDPTFAGRCD